MCREAHAAPFASYTGASTERFEWLSGEERIARYESSPGSERTFCRTYGSGMPCRDPERGFVVVPFGALDDDPGRGADDHLFVADAAP